MKSRTNAVSRAQGSRNFQGDGPTWILVAGGALLSTLSIRLGFKLKEALDAKEERKSSYGDEKISDRRKSSGLRSNGSSYIQNDGGCFSYMSANQGTTENKHPTNDQIVTDFEVALPLVTVPPSELIKENGVMWSSSPDRLELPHKHFRHSSNCSDSPCISESGSDIFSKREVIQKLRQQLKRRDDMIMEMQDQIVELRSSLKSQSSHSSHLQSLLDSANMDLLESERGIQRLRKVIADHCVGQIGYSEKPLTAPMWTPEGQNGHSDGYVDFESNLEFLEKRGGDGERIKMLKREVVELKEVLEGKEYLLQNYKGQKLELSVKVKELQQRLDSQLLTIL